MQSTAMHHSLTACRRDMRAGGERGRQEELMWKGSAGQVRESRRGCV